MSQPESNGAPRQLVKPMILPDGTPHYVFDDDAPGVIVHSWLDGDIPRSDFALPPKTDQVRETGGEELRALMNAMTACKRERGLDYLLWEDVLDVLHDMGYRKVAAPAAESANP